MASIYDIFGQNHVQIFDEGNGNVIDIDATMEEVHSFSSKATVHEIEDGSDMSDHIINKGRKVVIRGIKSDDPFTLAAIGITTAAGITSNLFSGLSSALVVGAGGALVGAGRVVANKVRNQGLPSQNVYKVFEEIYEKKHTVEIITALKQYNNMVLENLSVPRTVRNSRSLTFNATFKNVNFAQFGKLVDVKPEDTTVENAVEKISEGTKPVEQVSDTLDVKAKSWIISLGEFFFGPSE